MARNRAAQPAAIGGTAMPGRKPGIILSSRDISLLTDIFRHTVLSRAQVQEGYFGSVQRANARLLQLVQADFLRRHYGPFGSGQALYTLGANSVPVIVAHESVDAAVTWQKVRDELSVSRAMHCLKTKDIHLAALRAVRRANAVAEGAGSSGPWGVESWQTEPVFEYEYRAAVGGAFVREAFRPDATLILTRVTDDSTEPSRYVLFSETDCGTVTRTRMQKKLEAAGRVMASGLAGNRYGTATYRLLVVTPSATRRDYLRSIIKDMSWPDEAAEQIWFSTFKDVESDGEEQGFLGPVWLTGSGTVRSFIHDGGIR